MLLLRIQGGCLSVLTRSCRHVCTQRTAEAAIVLVDCLVAHACHLTSPTLNTHMPTSQMRVGIAKA